MFKQINHSYQRDTIQMPISLTELELFEGSAFVANAYRIILGREPDTQGRMHYSQCLQNGQLRKLDIIVRLRLSPEGRKHAVQIEGFWLKACASLIRQTPVIGWLVFLPLDILRLPFLLRPIQADLARIHERMQAQVIPQQLLDRITHLESHNTRLLHNLENTVDVLTALKTFCDTAINEQQTANNAQLSSINEQFSQERHASKQAIEAQNFALLELLSENTIALQKELSTIQEAFNITFTSALTAEADARKQSIATQNFDLQKLINENTITFQKECNSIATALAAESEAREKIIEYVATKHELLLQKNSILHDAIEKHANMLVPMQNFLDQQEPSFTELPIYPAFEDAFRGSMELIHSRLQVYMPFVAAVEQHFGAGKFTTLDIGCGRGEWLRLLTERGVNAQGVDSNANMVERCTSTGMAVELANGIDYLEAQPEGSLGIISAFHVVEHLSVAALTRLLVAAYRALASGGMLILETPNPNNIFVGSCSFYTDPSHQHPVVPATLQFFVNCSRLSRSQIYYLQEENGVRSAIPAHDYAIINLESFTNMPADYALIAYKA